MSGPPTERDEAPVRLDTSLLDEIRKLRAEVRSAVRSRPTAQLLSKRAAGRIIGIDRDETLGRLIDEGQIKTVLVGQHQRIPLAEVERFVAQGEQRKSRLQQSSTTKRRVRRHPKPAHSEEPDWEAELAKARKLRV